MSDHRAPPCDADYEYVRVSCAEIVLDQQRAARARGRGRQTRMVEFQRCRSIDTRHKGSDEGSIRFGNPVSLDAFYHFGRYLALEPVDLLMQIHD